MKTTITVVEPDFYKDFSCVATACRNNCCNYHWQISVDKSTYKRLRGLKQPPWLADNFGQYFKRKKEGGTDIMYAMLAQTEKGCALQTEDGLCKIHAALGGDQLWNTCRLYPRTTAVLHDSIHANTSMERGLVTSCEEVVRLLLEKQEPIAFQTKTDQVDLSQGSALYHDLSVTMTANSSRPALGEYHLIRSVCFGVLQSREYCFEHRLSLLCILLDKLETAEREQRFQELPQLLETFIAAVEQRLYDPLLNTKGNAQIAKLFAIFSSCYTQISVDGQGTVDICNKGMESHPYEECIRMFTEYMADKQYLLEHLFVNIVFTKHLPFQAGHSIWEQAQYLVSIYVGLRCMLSNYLAGMERPITDNELMDFLALWGRCILHNRDSLATNVELLKINQLDSLAHMLGIIAG